MACSFTVITTVDDFLKALNMEWYKNAFSTSPLIRSVA